MPYVLGIHLGATATSAAVAQRDGSRWGAPVPWPLGAEGPTAPTVLCKVQDGSFVAGEPARQQEAAHHEWVVRSFTKHLGDDAPLLVGSDFVPAQQLVATMIEWAADTVASQQGHPPEHIAVAHSATWGPYRGHLVQQALAQLGLTDVSLVPEPVAVGLDYANSRTVPTNGTVAVGNIGGTGFDATVLRRSEPGFEVIGAPLDADYPSGQDLDDEVFAHVRSEIGEHVDSLDPSDPQSRALLAALRAECTRAKEALSFQPHASVRVALPRVRTEVALSRSRFEHLVRPHLERVPELLTQAIQSAALTPDQLEAVVLAGGTARAPLLRQLTTQRLAQPQIDQVPELVAARGAAQSAVRKLSASTDQAPEAAEETSVLVRVADPGPSSLRNDQDAVDEPEPLPPPRPALDVRPMHVEGPDEDRQRIIKIIKICVAALLVIGGLVMTIMQTSSSGGHGSGGGSSVLQHK